MRAARAWRRRVRAYGSLNAVARTSSVTGFLVGRDSRSSRAAARLALRDARSAARLDTAFAMLSGGADWDEPLACSRRPAKRARIMATRPVRGRPSPYAFARAPVSRSIEDCERIE